MEALVLGSLVINGIYVTVVAASALGGLYPNNICGLKRVIAKATHRNEIPIDLWEYAHQAAVPAAVWFSMISSALAITSTACTVNYLRFILCGASFSVLATGTLCTTQT